MTPRRIALRGTICLSLTVICFGGGRAVADALVLGVTGESLIGRHPVGSTLAQGQPLKLEAGESVLVLMGQRTKLLTGPGRFVLTARTLEKGKSRGFGALAKFLKRPTAGQYRIGAVRTGDAGRPDDPWHIDMTRNGIKCFKSKTPIVLWRGADAQKVRASIEALSSGERDFFEWLENEPIVGWPKRLVPREDEDYLIDLGGQTHRQFSLVEVMPKSAEAGELLLLFAENRCLGQVTTVLDSLALKP